MEGRPTGDLPWWGAPVVNAGALVDLACLGGRGFFFRKLFWGVPAGRGTGRKESGKGGRGHTSLFQPGGHARTLGVGEEMTSVCPLGDLSVLGPLPHG